MLLSAVLVHAGHAALEDRKDPFNRVRSYVFAGIFLIGVIDALVRRKGSARLAIQVRFIGMQAALARHVVGKDLGDGRAVEFVRMDRTRDAAALYERNDRALASWAARLLPAFAVDEDGAARPDESFVSLYHFAFAAHRRHDIFAHRLADAVPHEPCGFVGDAD